MAKSEGSSTNTILIIAAIAAGGYILWKSGILQSASSATGDIVGGFTGAATGAGSIIEGTGEAVKGIGETVKQTGAVAGDVLGGFGEAYAAGAEQIGSLAKPISETMKTGGVISKINQPFTSADSPASIIGWLATPFGAARLGSSIASWIGGAAKDVYSYIKTQVSPTAPVSNFTSGTTTALQQSKQTPSPVVTTSSSQKSSGTLKKLVVVNGKITGYDTGTQSVMIKTNPFIKSATIFK
jgi:hypothetical protein